MKRHVLYPPLAALMVLSALVWTPAPAVAAAGTLTDFGQPVPKNTSVTALLLGTDGLIYGVTANTHLFVFDPQTKSITDKGLVPGNCPLALTWGADGRLYGGGKQNTLWSYDLGTGGFQSWQVPGGRRVMALATGQDGLLYAGTEPELDPAVYGRLYAFDPLSGAFADLGGIDAEFSMGNGLTIGPDGRVYGGTYPRAHFFVYDPATGVLTDEGQPLACENAVLALALGSDGLIYGGVQSSGHLFAYDPAPGTFADLGQAVDGQMRIMSLVPAGDRLYGGTGNFPDFDPNAHLFEFHLATQSVVDLGIPVPGELRLDSLVVGPQGTVYGGTALNGHFFSYEPAPAAAGLALNYDLGAPGSYFSLTGTGLPANSPAAVTVNGRQLGTVTTDGDGRCTFVLSTALAAEGSYAVALSLDPAAVAHFVLDAAAPLRPQEGTGPVFQVPAGTALTRALFLPLVRR